MKQKIRILHIAQSAGGVDRYLKALLKYIDKERFEHILICSYDYQINDYVNLVDHVEQIDMNREISAVDDFRTLIQLRQAIKHYHPDILYAHSSKAGALARVSRLGTHCRCIYNPHGWAFNMQCARSKQYLYAAIEKILAPLCSCIVCISYAEKRSALKWHICKESRLNVIFSGIDIAQGIEEQLEPLHRSDLQIPEDAFVVGMTGRLSQQKAPDTFLKAAKQIKTQIPKAHFLLLGDGEQREIIELYARENNLADSITITGWVENPIHYMQLFDVAMLLSRWEGFGLVLPEYMLAGKPVVATKADAIPDIIADHKNGLLVPVDDAQAASEAVLELYHNPALRERLSEQGKKDVRSRFDVRRVAKEHEALFEALSGCNSKSTAKTKCEKDEAIKR